MIALPTPNNLQTAASLLKKEDIVAFPTETVYGLGGLARSDKAVLKIYETKGRPLHNPLIVHVDSLSQAKEVGVFDEPTEKIVSLFWPGPLTVIVPRHPKAALSSFATAGLETVALRFSSHPLLLSLLRLVGEPLVAPSANPSGLLTSTTTAHVQKSLPSVLVLEGGATQQGIESTIVRVEEGIVSILRAGAIAREEIERKSLFPTLFREHHKKISSPGQTLHHYAPSLPLRMNVVDPAEKEAFLGFGKTEKTTTLNLSASGSLEEAAHFLFSFLHILDNPARYSGISVAPIPNTGIGAAINDRLKRASFSSFS
ncbi:MAG: threonylcarbamoyl-AMP synthase [Alphaproteobacteria bacterium RIFCSPLOWO2_01_FULL_45_8]|nr:MAG: threonylcarbamoyl-AMP synthase [Alphaproteobacteria bacterium GWB1_45_5]OFW76303.1 MAG: threonylcarbamoyl-AMP synthase [Alphaproteobacteria bacterium GWA1_45_9]OFW89425.1 MAG: threonylcarbamoyl-AMP synthase [Alphaproteobacteria bacterium RIFCSPHIGHO2_01_FULL_41_14]OFW96403.1 MAG: threonylcarbamoyl-AMP synthase [Alphaproteobacteria bacterium RIFCSPLOWO2_01_FULL_45_8]HCI48677.1 threonylcarbamoyl-AMP synthase [Holosporales bacterium]